MTIVAGRASSTPAPLLAVCILPGEFSCPHHELWLTDPDGMLMEIHALPADSELADKLSDKLSFFFGSRY